MKTRSLGRSIGAVLFVLSVVAPICNAVQPAEPAAGVLCLRAQALRQNRYLTSRRGQFAGALLERWWRTLPPDWLEPIPLGNVVLIDERGYGLTCAHLVRAGEGLEAEGADGSTLTVGVVAVDRRSDVALVRVNGSTGGSHVFHHLSFVPAAAQPTLGAKLTVLGRSLSGGAQVLHRRVREIGGSFVSDRRVLAENLLVLDGAVPAGWGGGAVIGADGALVGLALGWSGADRVSGYAVPGGVVESGALRALARVREGGWLGVEARSALLEGDGAATIESVTADSPADEAGLEVGDVVRRWGPRRVPSALALLLAIREGRPGEHMSLDVLRDDTPIGLTVVLGDPPRPDAGQLAQDRLGVIVQELPPELAEALGVPGARGVAIVEVESGGPGERVGLRSGDVMVALGESLTPSLRALGQALEALADAPRTVVRIRRGRAEAYGELRLRPGP